MSPLSISSASSSLFSASPEVAIFSSSIRSPLNLFFNLQRSFPRVLSSSGNASSSVETARSWTLSFSEIVPDTGIFDDFDRFPPNSATVSSSLLLEIYSLPVTKFKSAVETALANSECYGQEDANGRMACFFNKAFVNVGADLARLGSSRMSTEVDAPLAYDTQGIAHKVHELLKLYNEVEVSSECLLFKIPSTWQGIEASRLLEAEGIQTHLTFVYRSFLTPWACLSKS